MSVQHAETSRQRLNRTAYIFLNLTARSLESDIEVICHHDHLTEAHFRILWVLCRESDSSGRLMGDIADGLINRASDVTRLVDKLEQRGLVCRSRSPQDGRKILVKATPRGRKVFEKIAKKISDVHVDQWTSLTVAEQQQLVALLGKVLRARETSSTHESWLLQRP